MKYSGAVLIALIKRFRDKEVCGNHMTRICVKLFIEKKESSVVRFMSDFNKLTVSDEKVIIIYPKIYLVHVGFFLWFLEGQLNLCFFFIVINLLY